MNTFLLRPPLLLIVFSIVGLAGSLFAQSTQTPDAKPTDPVSPAQAPPPAQPPIAEPTAPKPDAAELIQRSRTILDGIDSNYSEPPSQETLKELETLIGDIQVAEPATPWLPYLLGRAYQLAGRNGDAIDQLRKFVQTREGRTDWKAHQVLGDLFVNEFPRLAQGSYQKAAELKPNEPAILTGLSNCANRSGNLDEGIRLARLAAEADGYKNVRFAHRLARALMSRQLWDEAETAAKKAMEIAEGRLQKSPGSRTALQILIEQYGLMIELDSGRILSSTSVDPNMYIHLADLTGDRADVMSRLAKHDQVAILETAVTKSAPNTPVVLREKYAAQLADAGRLDDAISEYEKVLEADPGNKAATSALEDLRRTKSGTSAGTNP